MRLTSKFGGDDGCRDDHCPAIRDTDQPEFLVVQGARLTDAAALADLGEIPGDETVVVIPRSLLAAYQADGR